MEAIERVQKVSRREFAVGWPILLAGALFGKPRLTYATPLPAEAERDEANQIQDLVAASPRQDGIIVLPPGEYNVFHNVVVKNWIVPICGSSAGK